MAKDSFNNLQGSFNYILFPNPTKEQLNVVGNKEKDLIDITIRDVNGKLVLHQKLTVQNYRAILKLDLLNGVYFVTLINQDAEFISKKLVITK